MPSITLYTKKKKLDKGDVLGITHMNCKLAYGCTRTVLSIGNYSFKFPSIIEYRLFLLGLLANMQESLFSKYEAIQDKLCPVVFSIPGGFLVVMKRATVLTDEEFLELYDDLDKFIENDDLWIPMEKKSDSFGWLDGKLVSIDYGN